MNELSDEQLLAFVLLPSLFWCAVWYFFFRFRHEKWIFKYARVPKFEILGDDVRNEANELRNFVLNRIRNVGKDANDGYSGFVQSAQSVDDQFKICFLTWNGWKFLNYFVYICRSSGIGITLYTYPVPKDFKPDNELEKEIKRHSIDDKLAPDRAPHYSYIGEQIGVELVVLLISTVSVIALCAFCLRPSLSCRTSPPLWGEAAHERGGTQSEGRY